MIVSRYVRKLGVFAGLGLLRKLYFHPLLEGERVVVVRLPGYAHPVCVRLGTSDVDVFTEVFVNEAYDLSFLSLEPRVIVDGGAYVGFSSLFFAHAFPGARVFAIEPEGSNFDLLVRNTRFYPNIKAVHAALWNEESVLQVVDSGVGKTVFQVVAVRGGESSGLVQGLPLDKLLSDFGVDGIDVLKLDVEGSEKELFESNYENWLSRVRVIVTELHDRFREGCSESFYSAVNRYGFRKEVRGDHVILFKEE